MSDFDFSDAPPRRPRTDKRPRLILLTAVGLLSVACVVGVMAFGPGARRGPGTPARLVNGTTADKAQEAPQGKPRTAPISEGSSGEKSASPDRRSNEERRWQLSALMERAPEHELVAL